MTDESRHEHIWHPATMMTRQDGTSGHIVWSLDARTQRDPTMDGGTSHPVFVCPCGLVRNPKWVMG